MSSYLQRLAKVFAHEVGEQLSDYTFVFPNHRAGLFFRKYLGLSLERPIFSPEILTINECFASLSHLRVADQLSLLMRLYAHYTELRPQAESIDQFLHWGKMMLADFSEIDNHLVSNVEALYEAVEDMRDIDTHFVSLTDAQRKAIERFWGEFHDSMSHNDGKMHSNFLRTWQLLYPLYKKLRNSLLDNDLAYEGMLHRHVIENWDTIPAERFKSHYVFVGFNALTESERRLMILLRDKGCADFYFDYENICLSDPMNRASLFMTENQTLFAPRYAIPANEDTTPPTITHVSVSSTVGEAREVYRILKQLYPEKTEPAPDFTRTVVVLPDEQLLIPLQDCFPDSVTKINVTMGYPLRASDLYLLVAYPEKEIDHLPEDGMAMLALLRTKLTERRTSENSEALYLLCKSISHIEKLIEQYPNVAFSADAVMQILRMQTKDMTIPYVGEPLNGLQVMGVLETRALDFDNIIITGFNDELYPGHARGNSFIPYILRRGFGLPTPERQNAIFAYNFYRMLSYAQHVWLITNVVADEQHSGEVSRYLYQLQWQYGYKIERLNIVSPLHKLTSKHPEQEKTDEVLERLEQMKKYPFSASMLNKYLYCQKQFYYRYVLGVKDQQRTEDIVVADSTLGTVVHGIMEELYKPFENKDVTQEDVRDVLNSLTEEKWQELPIADIKDDPLALHVVRNFVRNILEYDWHIAPFFYYAGETPVNAKLEVPELGEFLFRGTIDRIDKRNGELRVIDYKTGQAKLKYTDMEQVFDRKENQDKALQTFLYCWMLKEYNPSMVANADVVPHIYAVRDIASKQTEDTKIFNSKTKEYLYTPELEAEFHEELIRLIQEIYAPTQPFMPAADTQRCESCPYAALCKR